MLNRLADEPKALSMVADQALRIMHYKRQGPAWDVDTMTEELDEHGHAFCEAGCYRCLLSYYNQPEHADIDRRDPDAIKILVALANGSVERYTQEPEGGMNGLQARFIETLKERNLPVPDRSNVPLKSGVRSHWYTPNTAQRWCLMRHAMRWWSTVPTEHSLSWRSALTRVCGIEY